MRQSKKTYGAKAGNAFFAHVALNAVHALDHHVKSYIEFLVPNEQGILNIPLDQVLMGKSVFGQILELANQRDAFSASALARLADKGLIWEVPHVHFQILDLVRKQKGVWHEPVVLRVETLQAGDNHAENVLLCKVLYRY